MSLRTPRPPAALNRATVGAAALRWNSRARRVAAAGSIAVAGAGVSLAAGATTGLDRTTVVVFTVGAPMLAIIRLLPNIHGVSATIVGAAGAITINVLVAEAMLAIGAWSPSGGVTAVGVLSAALWAVAPHGAQPSPPTSRATPATQGGAEWQAKRHRAS